MWPTHLPWEIQALIVDALASIVISSVIFVTGLKMTRGIGALFVLWHAVIIALLISGGSSTWQHLTYAALEGLGICLAIRNFITLKDTKPLTKGVGMTIAFSVLFGVGVTYLLVAGVA